MAADVSALLARWTAAGLIDDAVASRIRAYEQEHAEPGRLRWPIVMALVFGSLLVGTGVVLFVAAHWDTLSPLARFTIALLLVALFHAAGAAVAERFPPMATALHALGTAALGAGIFLGGQIFNLDEHWPGGLMLWALGAAIGAVLLDDWPQFALAAILVPAWLGSEWYVAAIDRSWNSHEVLVLASGSFLLALAYFTAAAADRHGTKRHVLMWIGGLALPPAAFVLASVSSNEWDHLWTTPAGLRVLGCMMALGLPLAVAARFRGSAAWQNGVAALWTIVLVVLYPIAGETPLYFWWAVGAVGLVAWGVHDRRPERINMGAAVFAASVIAFYFSHVMDKLGRSMSMVGLGLLFLAGGWALERTRRRLIGRTREQQ